LLEIPQRVRSARTAHDRNFKLRPADQIAFVYRSVVACRRIARSVGII